MRKLDQNYRKKLVEKQARKQARQISKLIHRKIIDPLLSSLNKQDEITDNDIASTLSYLSLINYDLPEKITNIRKRFNWTDKVAKGYLRAMEKLRKKHSLI